MLDWLFSAGLLPIGLFCLVVGEFGRRHGTTPEPELLVVTGAASQVKTSNVGGEHYLWFTIEGQTVDYSSERTGFGKVVDAIRRGIPITIGVSTKRETLFPRNGWVALYTLSIGGEDLLTYHDTVTKSHRASNAPFILAAVLLMTSIWGLSTCYRNRHATPLTPVELVAAWNDPRRSRTAAILLSLVLYTGVMFAMLHDDSMPTSIKVFGELPLGLPLRVFLWLFFTILLIPLPFAACHGFRILFRHASEGGGLGQIRMIRALFTAPSRHSELRRSQIIVISIIAFYLVLMFGWAIYAETRGI